MLFKRDIIRAQITFFKDKKRHTTLGAYFFGNRVIGSAVIKTHHRVDVMLADDLIDKVIKRIKRAMIITHFVFMTIKKRIASIEIDLMYRAAAIHQKGGKTTKESPHLTL